MSMTGGPKVVTSGLVFYLDPANTNSYSGGSTIRDMINNNIGSLASGSGHSGSYAGIIDCPTSTSRIAFPSVSELDFGSNDFTIAYWVNFGNGIGGHGQVTRYLQNTLSDYDLLVYLSSASDTLTFAYKDTNDAGDSHFIGDDILNSTTLHDTWLYIAVQKSGLNMTGYRFNKDTVRKVTDTSDILSTMRSDNLDLTIGYGWSANPANELFGPFTVYNRVLTQAELTTNFNAMRGRYGI